MGQIPTIAELKERAACFAACSVTKAPAWKQIRDILLEEMVTEQPPKYASLYDDENISIRMSEDCKDWKR